MKLVVYLRVSTVRQGHSGLGLEAQRESIRSFAQMRGAEVIGEYVEIESGARSDRPALAAALAHAKRERGELIVARLDRLARNVAFVSALLQEGVELRVVDMPEASRLLLHVMAAVAEHERQAISERTKAALTAAKARGVLLGNGGRLKAEQARLAAHHLSQENAAAFEEIRAAGITTVRGWAAELNRREIASPEGGCWGPGNAGRLIKRLKLGKIAPMLHEAAT